uniref:GTP binding protein 3, mitochondrial n=1 Tax=Sinocyclocheilus grahami TaxID=75366 RepID=A0A672RCD9_SINGR
GPAAISGFLQALGSLPGLRTAEAGEFTQRAFYAGKLDLTEVEEAQRRQALRQMAGDLGRIYQAWSVRMCHVYIFFSDVSSVAVDAAFRQLQTDVENHLSDQRRGERLHSGVQVGIARNTNVGKSSLLNMLNKINLSEIFNYAKSDMPNIMALLKRFFKLSSSQGRNRLKKRPSAAAHRVEQVDLPLVVVDLTQLPSEPQLVPVFLSGHLKSILEHSSHRRECIRILNKSDRISAEHKRSIQAALEEAGDVPPACILLCHTRDGLEDLLSIIQNRLKTLCGEPLISSPSLTQSRHWTHLQKSVEALQQITGRVGAEEILDVNFKDFCIGK